MERSVAARARGGWRQQRSRRFGEILTDAWILSRVERQLFTRAAEPLPGSPWRGVLCSRPPRGLGVQLPRVGGCFRGQGVFGAIFARGFSVYFVHRKPPGLAAEPLPGSGRRCSMERSVPACARGAACMSEVHPFWTDLDLLRVCGQGRAAASHAPSRGAAGSRLARWP